MLRTSNNLNAASEFSRRYQTFLALTDFQVAMIFFSYVSAFVTSEVGTFWQNFWVFLPLNEKDWDLDTGISSLFTLAPGWCVFLLARCDLVCLNGLISAILAQTWAFFQASAALDGFLTLRMIVLNCDWLIEVCFSLHPILSGFSRHLLRSGDLCFWPDVTVSWTLTGHNSTSCPAGWRVYQAS